MKDKIVKISLAITVFILGLALVRNLFELHHLRETHSESSKVTDTLWIKRYKPLEPYNVLEVPKLLLLYHTDTVAVKEIVHDHNTIQVVLGNNQVLDYSTQFLAQYPNAGKLVQFQVKNNQLKLTQFSSLGQLSTQVYDFRPEFYNYIYTNNQLTTQQKGFFQKFGFSAEFLYRPISNLYDLNLGLLHKTRFSIIELGLNLHYYPTWQGNIGFDPYLKIRYQL